MGRDIFSRLIWGIRSSFYTALVATLLTALFGTLWGLVSAAANRQTDELMMRFCDLWMSFPSEVMILAMVGLLGPGIENIIIGCPGGQMAMVRTHDPIPCETMSKTVLLFGLVSSIMPIGAGF